MTAPSSYSGLIERLEATAGVPHMAVTWPRNPDGAEAAQALRNLEADNARLREALGDATAALASIAGLAQSALKPSVAALSGSDRP